MDVASTSVEMDVEETSEKQDFEMEDVDSSNSSSDDSDSDQDDELLEKLSTQVEENPFLYDGHVQLINASKKKGDLDRLRKSREKMSELFPLTEELWLDWIRDETNLAVSKEEKLKIRDLFERAVNDYMSVNLWVEYGQFSIGLMGEMDGGIDKCREIFERGVTAVGIHVTKGSYIWETFREFEIAMLGTIGPSSEEESSDKYEEETAKQKAKIINLFKRQLSVPLLDMEDTRKELESFAGEINSNIELGYNKALTKLHKILPYENALLEEPPPRLAAYSTYIDYELSEDEPSRIQCLFERALVENCLSPDVWKRYTDYLNAKLNIESVIVPVYERAIRNCPWSVEIWQGYLRTLEKHGHESEKIKGLAEKAFSSGFTSATELRQLWLTYLEYLRRQVIWDAEDKKELELLRFTFERAHSYLIESFGYDGDPQCEVLQYWARVEARHCKNIEKAREIWNDIMQLGHSKSANMWLEYIHLERLFGGAKHVRKLFMRALQATSDWPESIGDAWINFERDEGDLSQLETAISRISTRMKAVSEQRQKAEVNLSKKKENSFVKKKGLKAAEEFVVKKGVKRKAEKTPDVDDLINVDAEGFAIPKAKVAKRKTMGKDSKSSDASSSPKESDKKSSASSKTLVTHDSSKDERTVFLSNLPFDVNEDQVREIFSKVGDITDLRLVKDHKGRSKGYGYVEFSTFDLALKALEQDRMPINERPVFVSKCEDKRKGGTKKQFKYTTGLEKKKLFVRGLPFTLTNEQLIEIFKPYGELKEARLVTYRNGHSKGLAYVEYKSEADAATALLKTDGLTIESLTISVALSNPPERKDREKSSGQKSDVQSLGRGERDSGQRGHARTKLSFIPRALNRAKSNVIEDEGTQIDTNGGDIKVEENSKPLSNSDFRSLLLK